MSKTYYTPATGRPKTASRGKFRPVRLEADAITQRVSHDLYANPASGVRELLANEIRAAITAKGLGADPRIEVTISDEMIRVWGIDSLGMGQEIFDTVYTTLGRSSNFDGNTPGQFGLGRAAYTTISDHMLLETNCRNGDRYSVLGVEGRGYQTGLPKPDIPYGTRVTMAPREIPTNQMESMVCETARRSPIPIILTTEYGSEQLRYDPLPNGDNCIAADLPEAEIAINPFGEGRRSYLCGIPIQFTYRGGYSAGSLAVDIHDERAFPPTPDRERMTEKAEREISELIDRVIAERLAGFPRDLAAAMDHPDLRLAKRLWTVSSLDALNRRVPVYEQRTRTLGRIEDRPILNCHSFNTRQINAVRKIHPRAVFVKNVPELPYVTSFMKQHGIKPEPAEPKKSKPKTKSAVIHPRWKSTERIDPDNPPADTTIYRVAHGGDLHDNTDIMINHKSALTIHDVKGAVDIEKAKAAARARAYQTSRGMMTGQQIIDSGEPIYPIERPSLVECWGDGPEEGRITVALLVANPREHAELLCQAKTVYSYLHVEPWGSDEKLMECYLRLESDLYKRILRADPNNGKFCEDFLALEGHTLDGVKREAGQAATTEPDKAAVLSHTFKTSRGMMTGQEIIDTHLTTYPVTRQSLLECWGDGPKANDPSIAVLVRDGDDYKSLARQSLRVESGLWMSQLDDNERVVETYLRLDNPTLRRALMEGRHTAKFCDDLMRADGKQPVPRADN